MINNISLPLGIKDYSLDTIKKLDYVKEIFFMEVETNGYEKVITPLFENIDSIAVGSKDDDTRKIMKMIDPLSGDVLGLRSDTTPQIARYVTSNFSKEDLPIRLSYSERIIRNNLDSNKDPREIFQIGCESIGTEGVANDLELIQLGSQILKKLGFPRQVVTLNSSLLVNYILSKLEFSKDQIKTLFYKKDFDSINILSKSKLVPKREKEFIKKIVMPFALNKKIKLGSLPKVIQKEIEDISFLKQELENINTEIECVLDLLDVRDFNYYSNVTFDISVPEIKDHIMSGGRYNNLLSNYGLNVPAMGFALNVLPIIQNIKFDTLTQPLAVIELKNNQDISLAYKIKNFFANQAFQVRIVESKYIRNLDYQLLIKVDKLKKIKLLDEGNKLLARFDTFEELSEEEI
ncbi:MAG: ATP phosphoribosyltransferase regulatory subunit [Thermodesulfobacteriota bacterium]|nr:ATP phosphoribosyltransferase regulatory subunit [Candidatus Dadabacteria bacterium]|tara:strand:+ start:43282 stop:44496 length:1215 start_codon:yes stop_codon:yes gene_type:complete